MSNVEIDLLEHMLERHDWRKAAEFLMSSLTGSGFGKLGGAIQTVDANGNVRNVLDSGVGGASFSGIVDFLGGIGLTTPLNMLEGYRWGTVVHATSTHVMAAGESVILADASSGSFNVTLDRNVVSSGFTAAVVNIGATGTVTVVPDHGNLSGNASVALATQWESLTCVYASSPQGWYITGANSSTVL